MNVHKHLSYLASPYSNPDELTRLRRFRQARRAAGLFSLAGLPVYSPIVHGHTLDQEIGPLIQGDIHEFWLSQCIPVVRVSARIIVLMLDGWEESRGILAETTLASAEGIPIFYQDYNPLSGSFHEAITYLRNRYSPEPSTPGIRPREATRLDGVDPHSRVDASDSNP